MSDRNDTVIPFRRPRKSRRSRWTQPGAYGAKARPWWKQVTPILVVVPLAAFAAVLLWPSAAPALPETAAAEGRHDDDQPARSLGFAARQE